MTEIMLFTKPDCQKCDYVKEKMPSVGGLEIIDATTVDGQADAAFYEIMEMPFPVLVVDGESTTGAIEILGRLKELLS